MDAGDSVSWTREIFRWAGELFDVAKSAGGDGWRGTILFRDTGLRVCSIPPGCQSIHGTSNLEGQGNLV